MPSNICAFTGHRPAKIPFGHDEQSPAFLAFQTSIEKAICLAITNGFTIFRSGGAMGFDLWCAEAIFGLKSDFPHIQLHFLLPCETQSNHWPEAWRDRYFAALSNADEVTCLQARYTRDCMFRRNRALVDGAKLLIVWYSGSHSSGTGYTIRQARNKGIEIQNLYQA